MTQEDIEDTKETIIESNSTSNFEAQQINTFLVVNKCEVKIKNIKLAEEVKKMDLSIRSKGVDNMRVDAMVKSFKSIGKMSKTVFNKSVILLPILDEQGKILTNCGN